MRICTSKKRGIDPRSLENTRPKWVAMAAARVRNCFDGVTGDNDDDCTDDPWRPIFSKLRASSPAVPQPPSPHNFQDSHEKKKSGIAKVGNRSDTAATARLSNAIVRFFDTPYPSPPSLPPATRSHQMVAFKRVFTILLFSSVYFFFFSPSSSPSSSSSSSSKGYTHWRRKF